MEPPPDLTPKGFLFGTSGYYFDDWVGVFNPRGQSPEQRLSFYGQYFKFVEINNTFYRPPDPSWIEKLIHRTPHMVFALKVHREISHTRNWNISQGERMMEDFVNRVYPLQNAGCLYSLLIQLEDRVEYSSRRLRYLEKVGMVAVSANIDIHIEFRHKSWNDFDAIHALKSANIGMCNTEIPRFNHAFPLKSYATTTKGYLRYSGLNQKAWYPATTSRPTSREKLEARNARYNYLYTTDQLKERIKGQLDLRNKTNFTAVAFNNHYCASAVVNAIKNMRLLDQLLRENAQ